MKVEKEKFQEERNIKLNREIEKLRSKQDLELQALLTRMNSTYGEFKRDRALEFDKLIIRYKNRLNEAENQHKLEISVITKKKGSSI